jgi:predicted TIM-barrel fold metal-dependent hydrolase
MVQETVAIKMGLAGLMPLDWFMWGSDFPHSVGTYPTSRQYLKDAFDGVDTATVHRILVDNPVAFFGLDPDADITPTHAGA